MSSKVRPNSLKTSARIFDFSEILINAGGEVNKNAPSGCFRGLSGRQSGAKGGWILDFRMRRSHPSERSREATCSWDIGAPRVDKGEEVLSGNHPDPSGRQPA